ncbi:trypsin-like serine protease [Streptomyces sp. NPDC086554]|uniref:trypsin-like serine protease n=1 Tax=Streptomyces sp. NPDC086554 TaxID=3154864 RepID=UPI00341862A6
MRVAGADDGWIHTTRLDGHTEPGDSGSPVFAEGQKQVGVHWGGDGAGYSRDTPIAPHRQWIMDVAGV